MDYILESADLSFVYYADEQKKQTKVTPIQLTNKDKLLIVNNIKLSGSFLNYLLGQKENCTIRYKNRELNNLYPNEREDLYQRKITIIDNNEIKQIKHKEVILPQLIKNIQLTTNIKKNIYLDKVNHYKEKYKETKAKRKEIIQKLCTKNILTVEEGTKEYKKILHENKNKYIIKKLEARNDYIVKKVKLEIELEKNKQEIKSYLRLTSNQAREEIEKIAKTIGVTSLDFLNKKYDELSLNETKIVNLLFATCGNKDVVIIFSKKYDKEEVDLVNKILTRKHMLFIYITPEEIKDKSKFTKVVKVEK